MVHQSVYELIHTDDRSTFREQLHFALDPTPLATGADGNKKKTKKKQHLFIHFLTSFHCKSADHDLKVNACVVSALQVPINTVMYNPDQLPPENSSFLERSFVCRFRCLLDNSSGFLVSAIFFFNTVANKRAKIKKNKKQGSNLIKKVFALTTTQTSATKCSSSKIHAY